MLDVEIALGEAVCPLTPALSPEGRGGLPSSHPPLGSRFGGNDGGCAGMTERVWGYNLFVNTLIQC